MKIIKAGYEILTPINGTEILRHLEKIGRVCYKSEDKITDTSCYNFIKRIISNGHEAMIEHYSFSVRFICDRGVSHELVRHRLASFAQESTRYCNYLKNDGVSFILPKWFSDSIKEHLLKMGSFNALTWCDDCDFGDDSEEDIWIGNMLNAERDYISLIRKGYTPQEARSVLPNSLKTEVVMTTNLREWRHFLKLRTALDSHPQMREITIPLLNELKQLLPIVFDDIETGCL